MSVIVGHPTGNPNAFQAALAYFERGQLESICVPWMPAASTLRLLGFFPGLRGEVSRLQRRNFAPLMLAPKTQGRISEMRRLVMRKMFGDNDKIVREANHWLMRTMARECKKPSVTVIHSYEDCSVMQFTEARLRGKPCIYDMPTVYFARSEQIQLSLAKTYADWFPTRAKQIKRFASAEQKKDELVLSDLVLVPSSFAASAVRSSHPYKEVVVVPYGVDSDFWIPRAGARSGRQLRFIYAGQLSVAKGVPLLIEAWKRAGLQDATLELVGPWQLAAGKRSELAQGITWSPPCSSTDLREKFRMADIFVFPSFFEGFGLVILEAMACGLPIVASTATAAGDLITDEHGRLFVPGDTDGLVDAFSWFSRHRSQVEHMGSAARLRAEQSTWEKYRQALSVAVAEFVPALVAGAG